jgi:hypothetical protein
VGVARSHAQPALNTALAETQESERDGPNDREIEVEMSRLGRRLLRPTLKVLRALLEPRGYVIVQKKEMIDYCLHEYPSYERYREVQIFHNKRKIDNVWADGTTLKRVSDLAVNNTTHRPIRGLCHGTRNGFEQNFLNSLDVGIEAIGTDISETALDYENSVQWDFHDENADWKNRFDFVYTNSLDQSWQPEQALVVWLGQLAENGILIIEHSKLHGPVGASEMDPFGVKPTVVPYVLTMWFGAQISISHTVARKDNIGQDAWLFVISKNVEHVEPL